ncbi:MAG: LPS assembly lipoprotein LptE [Chitinispirillaceae bacterium]|nr:LPS assembly lipoprotein LptE [Chitinispirillaceae bacterium]
MKKILLFIVIISILQCGIYTFSGSTLPVHLKTIEIPELQNQSLKPNLSEDITDELNRRILSENLLRVVSSNGDASIKGTILSYTHEPYTFGAAATRQVSVEQYVVRIKAKIQFSDNIKNTPLFEGEIVGEGVYDFQKENEEIGRKKAINDLVTRILQKSLQSW